MTRFGPLVLRFVALGLLALVSVAVVSAIVVLPTSYINSLKERRADALFQLQKFTRLVSEREVIQANLDALEAHAAWGYVSEAGLDLAGLQRSFRRLLSAQRVSLTRVTPAASSAQGTIPTLAISVQFSTTVDKLLAVLSQLEQQTPYMRFETLTISSPQAQVPDRNPELDVRGTVVAIMPGDEVTAHEP